MELLVKVLASLFMRKVISLIASFSKASIRRGWSTLLSSLLNSQYFSATRFGHSASDIGLVDSRVSRGPCFDGRRLKKETSL